MITSVTVEVQDVSDKMFLREHVGSGEGGGVEFNLSRSLGMPALFIEVKGGPSFLLAITEEHVNEVLESYLDTRTATEETSDG